MSSPTYDNWTGQWKLNARISWRQSDTDSMAFVEQPAETFSRFEDAEKDGLERSMSWIDDKLNKLASDG